MKIRNKKIVNTSPKEKPKTNPKKGSKAVPRLDIKATTVW